MEQGLRNEGCRAPWDVLVISDEPVLCSAVRQVLERAGLGVASAGGGASGLAHPAISACRLVLSDLTLPDGSGLDVVRSIELRRPGLPVVLITGSPSEERKNAAMAAGATALLARPFEDEELLHVVREALDSAENAADYES